MEKALVARRHSGTPLRQAPCQSHPWPAHPSLQLCGNTAALSAPPLPTFLHTCIAQDFTPTSIPLWADRQVARQTSALGGSVWKESLTQVTGDRKGRELVRKGFLQERTPEGLSELQRDGK